MEPKPRNCEELIALVGGKFSLELGIDLSHLARNEIFKWLLASIFYGARIPAETAARTYAGFLRAGIVSAEDLRSQRRDDLVVLLDAGGYARYDYKTAAKLLSVAEKLMGEYGGDLNRLHQAAIDENDLESRLKALASGIGAVTCNIFLREMRGLWPKANPPLSALALAALHDLGFLQGEKEALAVLANCPLSAAQFEAALCRWGMRLRRQRCRFRRRRL